MRPFFAEIEPHGSAQPWAAAKKWKHQWLDADVSLHKSKKTEVFMNTKGLRQQRPLVAKMQSLIPNSGTLSSENRVAWEKADADQEILRKQIETIEKSESLQKETNSSTPPAQRQPGCDVPVMETVQHQIAMSGGRDSCGVSTGRMLFALRQSMRKVLRGLPVRHIKSSTRGVARSHACHGKP